MPGKSAEVLQEHRRLDEVRERRAGGLEDRLQVREHLLGLLGDAARRPALSRRGAAPAGRRRTRSPFALIACEYGAPWNGAGAASVRTTSLLTCPSSFGWLGMRHGLPSAAPTALKIAASTCCGSRALEQPDVQVQAGRLRERLEEARRDVGVETPATRSSEKSTFAASSGASVTSSAAAASASSAGTIAQPRRQRRRRKRAARELAPERLPGAATASLRRVDGATSSVTRRRPACRELADQMVEHRQTRRDVRRALGAAPSAHAACVWSWRERTRSSSALDALDAGAERPQPLVDALVALVDLVRRRRSSRCPRRRAPRSPSPCRRECRGSTSAGRRAWSGR